MGSIFFGDIDDPSGVDLTIISLFVGLGFSIILTVWQSVSNKKSQDRLISMARHYELRTALINLGFIFSGGDRRIAQNEENRENFVHELERYKENVEEIKEVKLIYDSIQKHPQFPNGTFHHCEECSKITLAIAKFVNDPKFQNPNHHYNTIKFEVSSRS